MEQILGLGAVAHDAERERQERRGVAVVQLAHRGGIARSDAPKKLGVRRALGTFRHSSKEAPLRGLNRQAKRTREALW